MKTISPLLLAALCACSSLPMRQVQPAVDQGYQKAQQGDWGGAIALYTQAISADPQDWQAYSLRGQAHTHLGQHEAARQDFAKWKQLAPKAEQPWTWSGSANLRLGRYADALADYTQGIAVHDTYQSRISRGAAELHLGRYEEALADARKGESWLPSGPSMDRDIALLVEAGALAFLRRSDEALAVYDRYDAWHAEGPQGENLFFQGMAYKDAGKSDRARAVAKILIESWPNYEERYSGDHMLELFDVAGRRAEIQKAVAAARAAQGKQDFAGAFKTLQDAWPAQIPGMPETEDAGRLMVALYPKLQDKPALPENGRRYAVQAKMFMKDATEPGSDGYNKAINAYNMLLSIAPWYAPAYFNAALLRAELKQYDWAVRDMKTYLALTPDAADARAAKDKIYEWQAR